MKEIIVEYMFECPFKGTVAYQLSELTSGEDIVCLLMDSDDCEEEKCPLIREEQILVKWIRGAD